MTASKQAAVGNHLGGRARRPIGVRVGVAVAMAGAALLVSAPFMGPGAGAAGSVITVTHTPAVAIGPCIGQGSLSYTVFSDSSVFRLKVVAPSTPCQPIAATAAVYAMPGGGAAWPQQLKESLPFTIDSAGTTDIVFKKDCTPVQFDVVTGATPQTISPLGQMHGPLLFPGNTDTAFQDVGAVCEPTTTTTPGSTTTTIGSGNTTIANSTTTTAATSTTAATTTTTAVVAGTSIVSPTTGNATVQGTTATRTTGTSPSSLAVTGVSSQSTALTGTGLFIAGAGMIVMTRRRGVPAIRMVTSNSSVSGSSPFGID